MRTFLIVWMILGIFAYFLTLGYFFNKYGYNNQSWKDKLKIYLLALFLFSGGGVGFVIALVESNYGEYGISFIKKETNNCGKY